MLSDSYNAPAKKRQMKVVGGACSRSRHAIRNIFDVAMRRVHVTVDNGRPSPNHEELIMFSLLNPAVQGSFRESPTRSNRIVVAAVLCIPDP